MRRWGKAVGLTGVRHSLDAGFLLRVRRARRLCRPPERGKGYGAAMLRRALAFAAGRGAPSNRFFSRKAAPGSSSSSSSYLFPLGLAEVIVGCCSGNPAARKAMEACGRRLAGREPYADGLTLLVHGITLYPALLGGYHRSRLMSFSCDLSGMLKGIAIPQGVPIRRIWTLPVIPRVTGLHQSDSVAGLSFSKASRGCRDLPGSPEGHLAAGFVPLVPKEGGGPELTACPFLCEERRLFVPARGHRDAGMPFLRKWPYRFRMGKAAQRELAQGRKAGKRLAEGFSAFFGPDFCLPVLLFLSNIFRFH